MVTVTVTVTTEAVTATDGVVLGLMVEQLNDWQWVGEKDAAGIVLVGLRERLLGVELELKSARPDIDL